MNSEAKLDLENQAKETRTELEENQEELTIQLQQCKALLDNLKSECAFKTEANKRLEQDLEQMTREKCEYGQKFQEWEKTMNQGQKEQAEHIERIEEWND